MGYWTIVSLMCIIFLAGITALQVSEYSNMLIPAYAVDGETITEVESFEHDLTGGAGNSFVQVDSDTYALAYESTGSDGTITTFTISADGSTITEVLSIEHDITGGSFNSLVQLDSDTYVLAYSGFNTDGFITTFNILADGNTITECGTCEDEHDSQKGTDNSLVKVDANTFALAYEGFQSDGTIKTFDIPADGSTITEVAFIEHDTDAAAFQLFCPARL